MFCLCFVCVSLVFFYVCQNPKILFSQNKILDFAWRKCCAKKPYVKHKWNTEQTLCHIIPLTSREDGNTCATVGTHDCQNGLWIHLCFVHESFYVFFWFTCVLFMMSFRCVYDSLCLLLCCVYVVLCWFFTSLVYVRLLASDLVPIDEALWVYLRHIASLGMSTANFCTAQRILASFSPLNDGKSKQRDHVDKETNKKTNMKILFLALKASQSWQ